MSNEHDNHTTFLDESALSYPLVGYLRDTAAAYRAGKDNSEQVRAFIRREHGVQMLAQFDDLLPKMIIALGKGR